MDRREADRFLNALAEVRASGARAAIATVVRVHGSAYRREGARMLVRPDGTYECALSGGCLEPAVAEAAARVMATGDTALISYDLADDSVWSLNIGCSGAVDIRIERVEDDEVTSAWLTVLARGAPAVLVTPVAGGPGRRIVFEDGTAVGQLSGPELEAEADAMARAHLGAAYPQSACAVVSGVELFFEVNQAPPVLVVFGAGQDAVPVVRQAWALGFEVTVVDPRAAYLQGSLFSGARLILTGFEALSAAVPLPRGVYAVVMSHHLERDRLALGYCLLHDPAYIGVLGPRARFERLLAGLSADGVVPSASALARVHSPVGLAIGAETPEEVAMSILAEILARRRGFEGGFLSGSTARLHRPADSRATARS
jgi:xanthine/CO dehydrogenase XdhC/CoxF family maturation factor